jgi:hypothetical protein
MSPVQTWTWEEVARSLGDEQPGTVLRVPKHLVEHPRAGGLMPSTGLPLGQSADFRLRYQDCRGLHIRDFGTYYEAHLDQVHPDCGLVDHLRQDAPGTYVAVGTALGALAGLLLGKKPAAIFAGAAVGGLLTALTVPESSAPGESVRTAASPVGYTHRR